VLERLPTRILVRGPAEPDCDSFAQRYAPWPRTLVRGEGRVAGTQIARARSQSEDSRQSGMVASGRFDATRLK